MREVYIGNIHQGSTHEAALLFLDSLGAPVAGLTHNDLTLLVLRKSDPALMPLVLTGANFIEIGSGYYRFILPALWTLTDGPFAMLWSGIGLIEEVTYRADVVAGSPGLVQVTFSVDDGFTPQEGAQIDVWDDVLTKRIWTGQTDIAGESVSAFLPGSYKAYLYKSGIVFTVPHSFTVVGPAAETKSISGTSLSIPLPTAPDLCVIYGNVYDIDGLIDDGQTPAKIIIDVARVKGPGSIGGKIYTQDPVQRMVSNDGSFSIELAYGLTVVLSIERCGIRKQFTVPATPSVALTSLL